MEKPIKMTDLVRQASQGNQESMEKLVKATRSKLFSYILRLTMDYHLAEDILQQVQTEIVMSLWRLRRPDRFWPWIYKHAWGMVQHHYRDVRKQNTVSLSNIEQDFFDRQFDTEKVQNDRFYDKTDKKKLFETIYEAMKKISFRQRTVLTMRCFDDMSFYDIGQFLDCSETNARVMFFRAKRKLKSQLSRKGFKANKMFLPALGLFGTLTSTSAKASTPATVISVSGSSIQVGFLASLIGTITSKLGILVTSLFSATLAWLTFVHLALIGVIALLLLPFIILTCFYFVYCDRAHS